MNWTIIAALIVQSIIARANKKAGSIVGLIITTILLVWGINSYTSGYGLVFLNDIEIPSWIFYAFCFVWYISEIISLKNAIAKERLNAIALKSEIMKADSTVQFYKTTQEMWKNNALKELGPGFLKESGKNYDNFIEPYLPYEGSALEVFFKQYKPLDGEYLIGLGNLDSEKPSGCFVLTNMRLIQEDGISKKYTEVKFDELTSYQLNEASKMLSFNLTSGDNIEIKDMRMYPTKKYLDFVLP